MRGGASLPRAMAARSRHSPSYPLNGAGPQVWDQVGGAQRRDPRPGLHEGGGELDPHGLIVAVGLEHPLGTPRVGRHGRVQFDQLCAGGEHDLVTEGRDAYALWTTRSSNRGTRARIRGRSWIARVTTPARTIPTCTST